MLQRTFVLLFMIFFSLENKENDLLAQTHKYQIFKGKKPIGLLTTQKTDKPDFVEYVINSDAKFRVIFEFSTQFTFETIFHQGKLCRSFTRNMLNDSERESTHIEWKDGYYSMKVDEEEAQRLTIERPTYSMASLYYEEPKVHREVFSERFGIYLSIKPKGNNEYILTMPDGRENIYRYENGRCREVEVDHMLATLYFRLLP